MVLPYLFLDERKTLSSRSRKKFLFIFFLATNQTVISHSHLNYDRLTKPRTTIPLKFYKAIPILFQLSCVNNSVSTYFPAEMWVFRLKNLECSSYFRLMISQMHTNMFYKSLPACVHRMLTIRIRVLWAGQIADTISDLVRCWRHKLKLWAFISVGFDRWKSASNL